MKDKYVQLLDVLNERLGKNQPTNSDTFKKICWDFDIEEDLTGPLFKEIFQRDIAHQGSKDLRGYFMTLETYFRLLEYYELKEARQDSKTARKEAKTATYIAVVAIAINIVMALIQIFN